MTTAPHPGDAIAAHRRRYEALRDAGQGETARGLPPLSAAPPAIPDGSVLEREELPGGGYWTGRLRRGEALRLVNREGSSSVALIAWRADEPTERINVADTVKVQWSAALRPGRVILSDMGRVLFSIVADDTGAHDALAGGSNAASCAAKHGPGAWRNTRDNFVAAVGKLGLDKRDIPPCLTLFAPVSVAADGTLSWKAARRKPGNFVDLRAEMDLLVALSNCPHPVDPATAYEAGPVDLVRFKAERPSIDDSCRTASPEAKRAFERTDRLWRGLDEGGVS